MSADPTRPLPEWWQTQGPAEPPTFVVKKRRRKGPLIALITFAALGNIGGVPQGVTLSQAGPNQVKVTLNLPVIGNVSATAEVTQSGPNQIHVHVTNFGGIPTDQLGNFGDFTITIPKLPAGVTIQSVSVTQQGLMVSIAGTNTTLSQNS